MTVDRKFAYSDDLAILHYANDWGALERALTQDIATLSFYFYKWKLKHNAAKTVSAALHLYFGIKLDRALTFCRYLESLHKKLTSRVGFLKQSAGKLGCVCHSTSHSHSCLGPFRE